MSPSSKPRWQFLRRNVLLVGLFVAITAGWCCNRVYNARLQKQLIASIGRKGGYVWLDVAGPFIDIQFTPSSIDRGCGQVQLLARPSGTTGTFTDNDLQLIEKLDSLRSIDFAKSHVSAEAIGEVRRLRPGCRVASSP